MGVCAMSLLALALVLWWYVRTVRQDSLMFHRIDYGLCRECGYNLRDSSDRCPECGHPFRPHEKVAIRRDAEPSAAGVAAGAAGSASDWPVASCRSDKQGCAIRMPSATRYSRACVCRSRTLTF